MSEAGAGVTVVVPTLNREACLLDTVRDLLAQSHRPLEILVVDQSAEASRALEKLAAEHPRVITYRKVNFRGLPQARNFGWQNARYEAIVYVDDDIRCGPELVAEHLRLLQRPGVGIVGGAVDEQEQEPQNAGHTGEFSFWTAVPNRGFTLGGEREVDHVPGGNFSCWRNVLRACGGVDERCATGSALYEETDLSLRIARLGYKVHYSGRARLRHLAAARGGCREDNVTSYVRALSHNRAMLMRRFLRCYHLPVAVLRLKLTCLSFALRYRRPGVLGAAVSGFFAGWRDGGRAPLCGDYWGEVRA